MGEFKMPCRDINALKPVAQQACKLFLEECKANGINVFVTQTLRDAEYQNSLYQQGRTTSGKIVTNADGYKNKSNHQSGMAWDIAVNPPLDLYDENVLRKAGKIAKKLGIEWGGDWKFSDFPHFQVDNNWKPPVQEVKYTIQKVKINLFGEVRIVDSININGNNHIKLRDLNCDKLKVEWKNNRVYVNDKPFDVKGITYQDYNYVKVKDLEQIGIKVGWDNNIKMILLND